MSDINQEQLGSLDNEYPETKKRENLRENRDNPLLIINIFDLFENMSEEDKKDNKKKEAALVSRNVPFFSLSFPGSFVKPKFKPLTGFVYNEKLQEKLRADIREQEESSDDMEEQYE